METRGSKDQQTSQMKDDRPMNARPSLPHAVPDELSSEHFSYLRLFLILIGSIFLAEVAAMSLIYELPSLPYQYTTLIDAGVMTILIFPVLYFLSFQPLIRHIDKRRQAEKASKAERQRFNDILETLPGYLVLLTSDYHVAFANRFFRERFGESHGRRCYEYLFGRSQPCEICDTYKVLNTMQSGRWEWTGPDGRNYNVYDYPFTDTDGATVILEMGLDITEQKQAEAQIREMALFPALNPDGVLQVDSSGQIKTTNPSAAKMGLYAGTQLTEIIPDLRDLDLASCIAAGTTQQVYQTDLGGRVLQWTIQGAPELGLAFLYSMDITERKHAEERLQQVNRALLVLNECNQVLVRSENEIELLQKMCEIIVNTGHYRMAWVGFAEQDQVKSVRPAAQFGFEDGYLDFVQITWADDDRGRGPTGSAIRQGVLQINQNFLTNPEMAPWRESALLRGYQSSIALPLRDEGSTFGALTIYSALSDAFDEEEVHLLNELADDLAFGIMALRVRAERNRAQEQVREMALFPALNPDAVLRVDASGRIEKTNPSAAQMGFCVGAQLTEILPDLRQLDLSACIAAGVTQQIQHEARLGEYVLLWTVRGVPDLGLAFLYGKDITHRKQDEAAIRQLSRIVEQTEDIVVVTNCDGVIEYVNPAFERLTGYTKEEILGKTPKILNSGIHDDEFYRNLWNTILEGDVFQSEMANRKKNGELYYEVKTIAPLRDAQGKITHFVATGKDITEHKLDEEKLLKAYDDLELRVQERTEELRIANSELEEEICTRKQTEDALRQSEQRLSRAQEIAHLGSWELDLVHDRLTWSDEVYRIFGLQPQEFDATYEAFLEAIHPDDRTAVDAAYSSSIREGRDSYEIEHRIVKHSNGEVRIVHEKCEHFRDEAGQIIRSIGMVHDITERKRAEEALRLSEEKFRSAFADATIGFAMTLPDGRFVDANPAYCRLTGYEIEELQTMNFSSLIHPEDRPENMQLISQILAGQLADFVVENRYLRKDGEVVWIRKSVSLVHNAENAPQWIIALVEDITKRKQVEEALRRSEALLSQTGEMAKVGGWELDVRTTTLLWSLETYRIHEVDFSVQPNVETAIDFYAPEARSQITEAVSRAINEGQPYDLELPLITAKGRNIWIRTMGQPVFHDGKCVRLFGAFQDITERKQAEAALRKAHDELEVRVQERTRELVKEIAERKEIEKQLRIRTTAMEAAANGILITDPQGNIQWANPALTQISGYEAYDLIGHSTHIFRSGQHDVTYYRQLWDTILSGQVWRGEITNRRKDGSLYVEEQTITPVRDENDQIQHFIAVKQDITERKQAEAELAEWNIKLQALSIAEREQRQLSESLAEATLATNKSMKLDEVLPLILEQVKAVIPYQLAIVMMFDGESFYDASHAGDPRWSQNLSQVKNRFPLDDFPLLEKMRQSHQPVLIVDTQKETNWMIVHGLEWSRSILCVPLLAENEVIGFLNLLDEQPDFFTIEMRDRLVVFASHAAVAIQNAWLFEQVRASNERLQSLSRRLVEIQENERLYIARELHDEAGQMLTSLMLDLVTLETQADQPDAILKKVTEMEESLNAVSENLHNVAMALRPASLDHLGLVPALRQYVESVGERYRLRVSFRSGNFQERLPANMETELYRIVQEALTNVVRHAQASQVDVVITVRDHQLIVMVEDDGKGFDPEQAPDAGHLGLFGMRERAEMIGGQLLIESKPGKGTTVMVEVDYDSPIIDSR